MNCILCKQENFKIVSRVDSKNSSLLMVVLCNVCGMVQQNPLPSEGEVNEYYSNEYRQDYKKTYIPKKKHVFRAGNLAIERLEVLKKNGIINGRLLDIGAGGGEFTYISGKLGFNSKGVEPNIGYSEYGKKEYRINLDTGQLADISGQFQLITMFHVLEHIPNPVLTFEKLWKLIESDGSVFIEVPNIETNKASPHNIYFRAHIHYFSEATLVASASPYFEKIYSEKNSNLRIIFRKKEIKGEMALPNLKQVSHVTKRLEDKGWSEYLIRGEGYKKFFSRVKQTIVESSLQKKDSLGLLNKLIKESMDKG